MNGAEHLRRIPGPEVPVPYYRLEATPSSTLMAV